MDMISQGYLLDRARQIRARAAATLNPDVRSGLIELAELFEARVRLATVTAPD